MIRFLNNTSEKNRSQEQRADLGNQVMDFFASWENASL